MNLIHPDFEILEQEDGIEGIYKAIEYPGRICYGSTDKICEGSAIKFVKDTLMKSNHGAPMEHGAVYLKCPQDIFLKYVNNPYSRTHIEKEVGKSSVSPAKEDMPIVVNPKLEWMEQYSAKWTFYEPDITHYYVSTNFRVIFENGWFDDLKYVVPFEEGCHTRRVTVKFTCDIGVSREYNRHRKDSPNEESTRYCNYSKDKFGKALNIIEPLWLYDKEDEINTKLEKVDLRTYCEWISKNQDELFNEVDYWLFANLSCEWSYMNLIEKCQWKQQQARSILPLDTKTTLVHTAFVDDWVHFFNLRAIGTTGAPHPQAKELAEPLMHEFIKRNYLNDEQLSKLKLNK